MATRCFSAFPVLGVWPNPPLLLSKAPPILIMLVALLCGNDSLAQTSQQNVYVSSPTSTTASVVDAFAKNGQTGTLSSIQGSPFPERLEGGLLAIDGQGKFLFVLNPLSNNISMFQIDQATGALTEVPNSPFAGGSTPSHPTCLAAEKSGKYLYVGYSFGSMSLDGAVNLFQIDAANLRLIPNPLSPSINIDSSPIGMFADPKGLHLYVGLGPNLASGLQDNITKVYSIDSATGMLNPVGTAGGGTGTGTGRSIAIDPQGRFFFNGWGSIQGFIDSGVISPVDGTSSGTLSISLAETDFPSAMLVEGSGKFLYVQQVGGAFAYSIDQSTGALTALQVAPLVPGFGLGSAVADPIGPFLYVIGNGGLRAFHIDLQSGSLTGIPGSPFPTVGQAIAISGQPVQAAGGPVAVLFPSAVDFLGATVAQPTNTRIVHLANTGSQNLAVNQIAMTGPNAGDFTATPAASCVPPTVLLPNASCAISVIFTPAAAGLRQASLTATDNAPGSPQSIPISGTGVPAASAVTLAPGNVSFPPITQGATGTPQNISLTNSGTAKLNIFSVALGGANPNDFSMANACTSALAINGSCTITATFAPLAAGGRTAEIIIADDAPGSPQIIPLNGNATPAFAVTPAPSGSTSATVSAGQTAQFNLQLAPGAGFNGAVSFTCAGAPVAAKCTAPSVLQISKGNPVLFSVTVTTSGRGVLIPVLQSPRMQLFATWRWLTLLMMFLVMWFARVTGPFRTLVGPAERLALCGVSAAVLLALLCSAGCAGGSSPSSAQAQTPVSTPAPIVTPSGTSTLTLTMTVSTASGKQLTPPPPVQLTLTVN